MNTLLAQYFPEGTEILFRADNQVYCGVTMDYEVFNARAKVKRSRDSYCTHSAGVFVGDESKGRWWYLIDVDILKINPTDKDRFYYQLRSAA